MNNLSKIKKLSAHSQKLFKNYFSLSILLVGSAARDKSLGISSDVDLIIYIPNNFVDFDYYKPINKFRIASEKIFHRPASIQIITPDDLEMIVSPPLLSSYLNDGIMIYGKDLKEMIRKKLEKFSKRDKEMAIFKRILFERYHFRANLARFSFSKNKSANEYEILLSKRAMFIIKGLGEIFKTSPQDVFKLISIKNEIPRIPILPTDFKDKSKDYAISNFIDQLVFALKNYLEKKGTIKLNVW